VRRALCLETRSLMGSHPAPHGKPQLPNAFWPSVMTPSNCGLLPRALDLDSQSQPRCETTITLPGRRPSHLIPENYERLHYSRDSNECHAGAPHAHPKRTHRENRRSDGSDADLRHKQHKPELRIELSRAVHCRERRRAQSPGRKTESTQSQLGT